MDAAAQPWTADRRVLRLLDYWRTRQPAAGRLPARADIDPVALGPDLLPYMALVDVIDAGGDKAFRFRLVGTMLAEQAGLDLTGHRIDELNPNRSYAAYINGLYQQSLASRRPVYSETGYRALSGRRGLTRRLICPLAADGLVPDMFVAIQVFETDTAFGDAPTYTHAKDFIPGPTLVVP